MAARMNIEQRLKGAWTFWAFGRCRAQNSARQNTITMRPTPAAPAPGPDGRKPDRVFLTRTTWTALITLAHALSISPAHTVPAPGELGWHRSAEGRQAADHILSWQSGDGTWPKNTNTSAAIFTGDPSSLRGTFDNGATRGELRFLARAFRATGDGRYERAFLKGLDTILAAQYTTGGWPQTFPPGSGYPRHITFNDGTMIGLMGFLREVATAEEFDFVDPDRRQAAQSAFDRGIQCILKCQIRVNGELTAWCAQHDAVDFQPRPARSYELASLSGGESAGIVRLLMSLDSPSPEVIRAVRAAAAWFEATRLTGIRQVEVDGDKRMVADPDAPPLWARFYEIDTNRPIFCGRDGIKKYQLSEIEPERRNGYAWYGDWGTPVLHEYDRWKPRWTPDR